MDVFDLVARIRLDSSEYEQGVGKAQGTFSKFASGVGKGLATVAKAGAVAVSAAATGVAALTKMGVEGYAQYEQLVGGVETLFKDADAAVMKYAENAYKTSGLSANAYMETVTSFSASLIQSLDDDTAKAAEVADMAITDMSDNANKMGTSIEMIQNAYNGFAKGNFTMLDNLKLGYGGTQEEMKRLLKKAEEISGIKYDISSFSDIAEAIHVIQADMEISGISYEEAMQRVANGEMTMEEATELMGTTAKEAAGTISGSLAMMKASWENLVVGIADKNANLDVLINNLVESTATAAGNLIPAIERSMVGIGQLVEKLAPIIASSLPGMIESILPSLLNAALNLITSLANALPGLLQTTLPVIISAALSIVMSLLTVLTENLGLFLQIGIDAIVQLVSGIAEALPQIIAAAVTIISELINTLTSPENLTLLLDTALLLIENIVTGLIDNLPLLIEAAIQLIQNLVTFITDSNNLNKLIATAVSMIETILDGLVGAIPMLTEAAVKLIIQLVNFLLDPDNISMLIGAALDIVIAIATGLFDASYELTKGVLLLIDELIKTFMETDWEQLATDIIDALLKGLKKAWESVKTWFGGVWDSLFDRDVNVSADANGNVNVNGHATGLDYVPYDEYPALLHRGEAVLTAAEARVWRNNGLTAAPAMAGGIVINQYIQSVPQTPADLANATEAYFEQARWML